MKIFSSTPIISIFLISLQAMSSAQAERLTDVSQIISRANIASYYSGIDGRAQARMKIVDSHGNKQLRQFTILRKDHADEGDQDMLVFFSRPSDVKGTVFRVEKKVAGEDNRWLYLPALDLVKRISSGDKRTSFVGSNYYYEDVSGRNPAQDQFTIIDSKAGFYTLRAQPKDKNSVEFSYYIVKIDQKTFLPMLVTYFNGQNNPIRKMEVLKTKIIQGFTTVIFSKITQFSDNSYTEMQFRNIKYNLGLPDSVFSERSLRKPPKKWLN